MDSTQASPMSDDLSALAWVQEEVRKSLETANKALYRCLKEAVATGFSDVDALDPAVLRSARQSLHQAVGALELAGLPAGAMVLRAAENVVQRFVARPQSINEEAVRAIESSSFALLDLMRRRLAGKPVSSLALFPQYETLMSLGGNELARPSDLWMQEWPPVSLEVPLAPPAGADARPVDAGAVSAFETGLLKLLRGAHADEAVPMAALCASLAAGAAQRQVWRESAMWLLACGFLEGLADGRLPMSVHVKRVLSALLGQMRSLAKGQGLVSDRIAHELLFFCAQAGQLDRKADEDRRLLDRLRDAFRLTAHEPVDLVQPSLGRYDPAWVAQAAKRVAAAKDGWSAVAGGELLRLGGLNEQFALVADSLRRLYPDGEALAQALSDTVAATVQTGQAPEPGLAMEVATSLLYIEASLDEGEFELPQERERVQRLAQRMAAVRSGHDNEPLEPWMEALYRRVSDRQTIGSVVQELRNTLGETEKLIDQFFRDPDSTHPLVDVPQHLKSMKGVLAVLGLDVAAQAVQRMRADVEGLLLPGTDVVAAAQAGVHDRLASNLSALGFLVDMLGVQPGLAKSLFVFDDAKGLLSPIMGRAAPVPLDVDPIELMARPAEQVERVRTQEIAETLVESVTRDDMPLDLLGEELQSLAATPLVQDQPQLAAKVADAQAALDRAVGELDVTAQAQARDDVVAALTDFAQSVSEPVGLDLPDVPTLPPVAVEPLMPVAPVAPASTGLEQDDEMRDIFIEEAREVITEAREALGLLRTHPDDVGLLTTLRRAFHTLKGSSRMVGLKTFGEGAWAFEQLYNAWLASQAPASDDLQGLTGEALDHLAAWIDDIVARRDGDRSAQPLISAADALRLDGRRVGLDAAVEPPLVAPEGAESEAAAPVPPASLLDVEDAPEPMPEMAAEQAVESAPPPVEVEWADSGFPDDLDVEPVEPASAPDLALELATDSLPADQLMADLSPAEPEPEAEPAVIAPAEPDSVVAIESLVLDLSDGDAAALDVPRPEFTDTQPSGFFDTQPPDFSDTQPSGPGEFDELPAESITDEPLVTLLDEPVAPDPALLSALGLADDVTPVEPEQPPIEVPSVASVSEPEAAVETEPAADAEPTDEQVKVIGPLRISIPLFNIFLNEADEQSRRLTQQLGEWSLEWHRPVGEDAIALAHSLAGNSGAVGYGALSGFARLLEHALMKSQSLGQGDDDTAQLFNEAAEDIRRLLHQFAAGFLKDPAPELVARLEDFEHEAARRLEARSLGLEQVPARGHLRLVHGGEQPAGEDAAELPVDELETVELAEPTARVFEPEPMPEGEPVAHSVAEPEVDVTGDAEPDTHSDAEPDEGPASLPVPLGLPEVRPFEPLTDLPTVGLKFGGDDVDLGEDADIDAQDAIDADLFPIFEEEALELLPQLAADMRQWVAEPDRKDLATACMRTLHTFKGGARLAGAMRLGELAHRMESAIERLVAQDAIDLSDVEPLESRADVLQEVFDALRRRDLNAQAAQVQTEVAAVVAAEAEVLAGEPDGVSEAIAAEAEIEPLPDSGEQVPSALTGVAAAVEASVAPIDWSQLRNDFRPALGGAAGAETTVGSSIAMVRVRPRLLDRLVNHAGEVSITRTRLGSQVQQMRGAVTDLTDNLERLRQQLRDIELQAETQLSTRMEAARAAQQEFDPLEFDRYTRFQELTRMMAESVNDVATVQRGLLRSLETAEDQLAAQSRLTRDLQDDLLRTRMVEFEALSDRLYRVVRQAAKETGKQARLDLVGGQTEVDRGVLDRMAGAFEHLLRNCITHGIESPAERQAQGKDPMGAIIVAVRQEGNEVSIEFRDDGAGLNVDRIRSRAQELGLMAPDAQPSEAELAQLIFTPGFSTAESVTELAGRGIGMDVVRSDVNAMGGRIETASARGQGTSFKLILPLTTAVTKVVMVRCGDLVASIPTNLVEMVRRTRGEDVEQAYTSGTLPFADLNLPFFWFGALLQHSPRGTSEGRSLPVVIVRSAQQRVALHVDEVLGNQDVVVKNLGPQLSRVPGLAGMTLLASGAIALIYNPVALATVYGVDAQAWARQRPQDDAGAAIVAPVVAEAPKAPLVLVVDDSLTVRRVTQRLLTREGYRVTLAKDGLEALEKMAEELPRVVLSDIEMPRMDGFDLVRNLRGDERWRDIPIVMITSRIAQKHRDYAAELGVNHYLGKPYSEEELLALVARYARAVESDQPVSA